VSAFGTYITKWINMALQMKACNNLQNKRKHLHECFNIPGMTAPLRAGMELA